VNSTGVVTFIVQALNLLLLLAIPVVIGYVIFLLNRIADRKE